MNLHKLLTLVLVGVLFAAMGTTSLAASGGGNVGNEHKITGQTFALDGSLVAYSCVYVHRTRVAGGFQDKQTCTLAANAPRPSKPTTRSYGAGSWASDYLIATTGQWITATSWEQTFLPDGTDLIVSFYAAP